ncbi:hypothetical protein DFJ63DRAFT_314163 [Scheffersomyces coipomensis]|uniref:uncharacterized protein n=1 Tax=Scheffersomyces coipomensis TaxID=1788519 RepID=UPI00315D487C
MSTISKIYNCENFVSYYNTHKESTINLIKVAIEEDVVDKDEFRLTYEEGLAKLKELIIDIDKDKTSSVANEISSMFEDEILEQTNYAEVLITAYKVFNPHIFQGFSSKGLLHYFQITKLKVTNSIKECCENDHHQVAVNTFFDYCTLLNHIMFEETDKANEDETSIHNLSGSKKANSTTFSNTYELNNSYFKKQSAYIPDFKLADERFLSNNSDSLRIIPKNLPRISYSPMLEYMSSEIGNEAELESNFIRNLRLSSRLFLKYKVNLRVLQQKPRNIEFDENTKFTFIPDVIITLKESEIPIELKFKDLKLIFHEFEQSRHDNTKGSKKLIEFYSQCFLEMISTKSKIGFLSDGKFAIAILLESVPPDFNNFTEELRPIKCFITTFDSTVEKFDVALFIMLFIFQNKEILRFENEEFKAYKNAIYITDNEKVARTLYHYQILDKFGSWLYGVSNKEFDLSIVNQSDLVTTTTDETLSSTHVFKKAKVDDLDQLIEDRKNKLNDDELKKMILNFGLEGVFKAIDWFPFGRLDASQLVNCEILSGDVLHESYSTVLRHSNYIYKIVDPVRVKIDKIRDCPTFYHRIKAMLELFEREICTYTVITGLLLDTSPKVYEIGYLSNDNKKFAVNLLDKNKRLKISEFSLSGLYMKMQYIEGKTLTNIPWSADVEELLRKAINDLHAVGVSHGDLHIGNVMFNAVENKIKILDFGRSSISDYRGLNNIKAEVEMNKFEKRKKMDLSNLEELIVVWKRRRYYN